MVSSSGAPGFRFTTERFWLALHHFLYVLGRAEAGSRDAGRAPVAGAPADAERGLATLAAGEREAWREAVAFYAAGPSRRDALFDRGLVDTAVALAAVEGPSLAGAAPDTELAAVLERAAPLYRAAWWPAHRAAGEARVAALEPLLAEQARR
jgi:hypothetical protein